MDGLKELVGKLFTIIFNIGGMQGANPLTFPNPLDPNSGWHLAFKVAQDIYSDFMVPIGIGLLIIWFLVAFIQKSTSEQMNFDQIFLLFVKLIAAFYLMTHGMEIFIKLWGLGNNLLSSFSFQLTNANGVVVPDNNLESAWSDLTGGKAWNGGVDPELPGFWRSIGCIILLMGPFLASLIMGGCYIFIIYSRTLEMLLRVTMAPIALSDFFAEGLHSNAWRYLKTFLAICLQGFCLVVLMRLFGMASAGLISGGNFAEVTIQYFVVTFSLIALMFKSLSFCKELVGV